MLLKLKSLISDLFRVGGERSTSSEQLLATWESKTKPTCRIAAAIAFTFVVYFGFLLATPEFSASRYFLKHATDPLQLLTSLPVVSSVWSVAGIDKIELHRVVHAFALIAFFLFFLLLFWTSDPLSNSAILNAKEASSEAIKTSTWYEPLYWLPSLLQEYLFYSAHILPSRRIHGASDQYSCLDCGRATYCANRLDPTTPLAYDRWLSILRRLDSVDVKDHLTCLLRCRWMFYVRYGLIVSLAVLSLAYGLFRTIDFFRDAPFNLAPIFLWYWILLSIVFLVLGRLNSVHRNRGVGVWGLLKANTDRLFRSEKVRLAFAKEVCQADGRTLSFIPKYGVVRNLAQEGRQQRPFRRDQLVATAALITFLDKIVLRKLSALISDGKGVDSGKHVRNILLAIEEYYSGMLDGTAEIAAELFLIGDGGQALVPSVVSDKGIVSSMVSISVLGETPVASSFRDRKTICETRNLFPDHYPKRFEVKSAFLFPLTVTQEIRDSLEKRGIDTSSVLGVVCVSSSDASVFSSDFEEQNVQIISPFSTRLSFEVVYGLYASMMKERNHG